jgi:FkbM family methyltransferase
MFTFLLNSRRDHIQKFLERGEFYEREELELICQFAADAKRLLDVGANIGNHSIYLAHRLNLTRVTPIEPQPSILPVLKANLGLNWHKSFDLSHLGLALSDRSGLARIGDFDENNIGGTRVVPMLSDEASTPPGRAFDVPLRAGDDLFRPGDFDLIKIDVEGLEIAVMEGMRNLLAAFEGVIFVEVHDDNAAHFADGIKGFGFRKAAVYRRYQRCENWVLTR